MCKACCYTSHYFEPPDFPTPSTMMRFLRTHAELITGVCVTLSLALFGLLMYLLTRGG